MTAHFATMLAYNILVVDIACTNTARSLTQAYLITFATTIVVLLTWSVSSVYDIPALPNAKISSLILLRVMICALIKLGIYRNYIMSKVRLLNRLYISMCLALEFTTYLRHNIWLIFAQAYGKVVFCTAVCGKYHLVHVSQVLVIWVGDN